MAAALIPVSVIVCTKNEALRIDACLAALQEFSEIFVVDSHSTDGTCALAAAKGAHIVSFAWNGQYPKKKEWCLQNLPLQHDMVLFVDADEMLTPALCRAIRNADIKKYQGFFIAAKPIWQNTILHYGQKNNKLMLMNRHCVSMPHLDDTDLPMGEMEGHYQPIIDGAIGRLVPHALHDCGPVDAWYEKHRRYAVWECAVQTKPALQRQLNTTEIGLRQWLKKGFRALPCRYIVIFFYGYFLTCGFLDGRPGLNYALARAWYYKHIDDLVRAKRTA